jgi:polysaccharide pyruvyl transferase WcaK-like protein
MHRRTFIRSSLIASLASIAPSGLGAGARQPQILLRSSWQTVNIGDIAHTPGVLALLEKHIPEAAVRLWPGDIGNGVKEMLAARFPSLRFVETSEQISSAFEECDFFLHGSGPSLVAANHVEQWAKKTGKSYGIYGITSASPDARTAELLNNAAFVFFRDSVSLASAKDGGVRCPIMEFGPDGAFAADVLDGAKADAFLKSNALEPGHFLCCIPRARKTPYWRIARKNRPVDLDAQALNARMQEHDHAPHREAIVRVVRETGLKVLICPEDETQMTIGREALYDPLPDDVKARVVWRETFWLTNEALSVYRRSAGLFGNEMHSPIMCIGNGIPAIVCRWSEQTSKGYMWRDIGLDEWLFDFDNENDVKRLPSTVVAMARDTDGAKAKVASAQLVVRGRQLATMALLRQKLQLS